jgi:hypothetical protein
VIGEPRWSSDGKELFYISNDQKLVSVALSYRNDVEATTPKPLFCLGWSGGYSVSRDGRRFLIMRMTSDPLAAPIEMVLNWPAALKK